MRRQTTAKLPLRGSQCAAHPCSKVVGAQSMGHPACEAKRVAQSQGCRRSKACRHSAPNVDRRDRVQLVDEEGHRVTRNKEITEFPRGREKTSLPGRWRWVDRPIFCELSIRETPLATLIHQRRLTPSCEGQAPTAERTVGPARMIAESLTPTLIHQRRLTPSCEG